VPRLLQPVDRNDERRRLAAWVDSWDGVDRGLFEQFCELRRARSVALGVPPCIVFNDCALRDMARRRPVTVSELLQVHGVGEKKSVKFGPEFVRCIGDNCARQSVAMDQISSQRTNIPYASGVTKSSMAVFPCFDSGCSVEQVSLQFGRSHPRSMDIWTIYPTATHHGSICVGGRRNGRPRGRSG